MSPAATDPAFVVVTLIAALLRLVLVAMGTLMVIKRRVPRARLRFGPRSATTPPQPVRLGGFGIFLWGAILMQETAALLAMPGAAKAALVSTSLLAVVGGVAWLVVRRD